MSITGDFGALDELARFLDELGKTATAGAAPAAAAAVGSVAAGQYAAGGGPDGAWPRNQDGSVPLQGPTREIHFAGSGAAIVATAPDVLEHHMRPGPRHPARPVFPTGQTVPASWDAPIEAAVRDVVDRRTPRG